MVEDGPMSPSEPAPRSGLTARFVQLIAGLVLFGVSLALLVRSELGLDPWDVFHQGLSVATGLSIGACTDRRRRRRSPALDPAASAAGYRDRRQCRAGWAHARRRPAPDPSYRRPRAPLGLSRRRHRPERDRDRRLHRGGLGPGPRDGLMVGLARDGRSLRVVRTAIEVSVLIVGWLLGGTVGIGTVLFALTIGPIVHRTVPAFSRHAVHVPRGGFPAT